MKTLKNINGTILTRTEMSSIRGGAEMEVICRVGDGRGARVYCHGASCTGTNGVGCSCTDYYGIEVDRQECAMA